ncbi:MAG: hypothetical protein LAT64_10860 [Phycisphaerales bacterium]|nr:hypothetical protein [Planctomycetota bacterium]MCH8509250.1 hypothetical protein [Phycisphaerales bacterium]
MLQQMLVAGAGAAILSVTASGQVIFGNYPPSNDGTQSAALGELRQKSFRFTMGADSLGAGDLMLRLRNFEATDQVIVELRDFTGSNLAPGTNTLLNFNAPTGGGADIADYLFTPDGSFTLQANATYWLVVSGGAGTSFDWMASSPGIAPTGLATFGSTSFTTNAGGTWTNSGIINTFEFRVIPTPGVLAMAGAAGLIAGRRRRG